MPRGGRQKGADTHRRDKEIAPMLALMCHLTPHRSRNAIVRDFIRAVGPDFFGGGRVETIRDRLTRKVKRHLDQGYGHRAEIARAFLHSLGVSEQHRGQWQQMWMSFEPTPTEGDE
jgi:hypothetical protein